MTGSPRRLYQSPWRVRRPQARTRRARPSRSGRRAGRLLLGVAVGGAGGLLVNAARQRGWAAEGFAGSAALGLAVCAYASAVALHGNGFIAAFVGGLAFGTTGGLRGEPLIPFVEETGALVSLLVWLAFGAVAGRPLAVEVLNWQIVLYAVLSLTVIRMAPVAAVPGRHRARPGDHRPGGLVRSPGPGLGGVLPCLPWRNWAVRLPIMPLLSSRSPWCSASSHTVPRQIRWPPGTPRHLARQADRACRGRNTRRYPSAGSSAGAPAVAKTRSGDQRRRRLLGDDRRAATAHCRPGRSPWS